MSSPANPASSSSAVFLDPSAPPQSSDPRPLWQQQEAARAKRIRQQMKKKTTPADRAVAALNGTLVGKRIAKPPAKKKSGGTPRRATIQALTDEKKEQLDYIADDVISCADQGTADRSISVNEMQIFLKATPYQPFMEWLTGLNDDGYSRFHEIDEDNSQSIELGELAMALGEYLDVMGEGKFVELLEVARRNQERFAEEKEKKRLAAKKAKLQKARRETEFKEREEKRRLLNARELTSKGGHEKLNKVRHRLLAASYTSFGFGSDLAAMFAQFDKDGSGALDIDELKGVVRRNLHISQKEVSDFELETLFAFLDADNGGTIEMEEITKFLAHDLDENDDGAVVLPKHLQHIGERTAIEELTDLINFKTEKELQVDALEPMAPPGEIPWNHSTHSPRMRTTYQTTGIGVTFHRPQNY